MLHPFNPGHLLFLRYAPETPLVRNRFNILEPRLDVRQVLPLGELDVVLTPLVAFDHTGQRLGMGAVLRSHPAKLAQRRPYPIGLAHDCQQVEHLPTEHWDIPLPEILTPLCNWAWHEPK